MTEKCQVLIFIGSENIYELAQEDGKVEIPVGEHVPFEQFKGAKDRWLFVNHITDACKAGKNYGSTLPDACTII
jgi:hypothetical protein